MIGPERGDGDGRANDFKGRHLEDEIILWAVRWCCEHGVSCRERAEMLEERGVALDHATIFRRTQRRAPEIERRLRSPRARRCGARSATSGPR